MNRAGEIDMTSRAKKRKNQRELANSILGSMASLKTRFGLSEEDAMAIVADATLGNGEKLKKLLADNQQSDLNNTPFKPEDQPLSVSS